MTKQKNPLRQYREFGALVATALVSLGALRSYKHHHFEAAWVIGVVIFTLASVITPSILAPLYRLWMAFGRVLGWINSRILLLLIYYLFITPVAFVQKLAGRDPLQRNIDRSAESYWQPVELKQDHESLEHLY